MSSFLELNLIPFFVFFLWSCAAWVYFGGMGSAASLEALPDELDMAQLKIICGDSFSEAEFKMLAADKETITKAVFLNSLENKTDVFLTHDWGIEGRDNHACVAEINRRLKNRGLTTWFDSEKMEGNVKKHMAMGIDNAQCIITFVTKRYIGKVGGFNAEDNCQLEFNYAARRKTSRKMIPVVMEDCVRNTGTWDGEVGLVLGGKLYVDMCGDIFEDAYAESCIDDLYTKIIKIIKKPVKGFTAQPTINPPTQIQSFAETLPKQVVNSPKKEKKNMKPLRDLTVDDVSALLESCKLSKFIEAMAENDVDGPTLMETQNDDELKEFGISLSVKARMFYKKLDDFKLQGVPFSLIGIPEEKENEEGNTQRPNLPFTPPLKFGDGSFTIEGATGDCSGRINGTYEIGDDMLNGLPVYHKKDDDDTFIELVKGVNGWRWYIKKDADRGPKSHVCFGYAQCQDMDMRLPSDIHHSDWYMCVSKEFGVQATVTVSPTTDLPPPPNISRLLLEARSSIKAASEALLAETAREPLASSFKISGATGKSEKRVNGIFEPTNETQNGFPVYKKKGDNETWVEMVYKSTTGWRWYLKPTVNKGPDSSVCFAYFQCEESNVKLPQDCPTWHVNTDDGFVTQSTCVVCSASSKPMPPDVSKRLQDGLDIVQQRKDDRIAEETRGVIPGTFRLDGATGKSEGRFNGVFEPSDETQNSFPVYRKKGDSDTWIELVHGASGWRWYLKPTANKGPDSSVCFAYFQCDEVDVKLPSECTSSWYVHTASGFVTQVVNVSLVSTDPLPDRLQVLVSEGKAMLKKKYDDKIAEETRNAQPGSFRIEGASGKSCARVNGTFEPTIETQNGFPVYKKKGDEDTWVEIVHKPASGWRWYLKPTTNKGPDSSICFAYAQCNEDDVKLPGDETEWFVSTNDGFVKQNTVKRSRVGGDDTTDVLNRLIEGKSVILRMKNERIAEETRGAIMGSFQLSGATGKSAARTNGVFEPTEEVQNGMPVYRKKGDTDTWIELVHGNSGWRWYLKPTVNKGPSSSICFAYYSMSADNITVPALCTNDWFINTADGFKSQSSIKVEVVGESGQPPHVAALLEAEGWIH